MNISLDYDDTYTRDPKMWNKFVDIARAAGHKVYCVTMRYRSEGGIVIHDLEDRVDDIFFTGRQAKQPFMLKEQGINIHVWIDDNPSWINTDALPMIGME